MRSPGLCHAADEISAHSGSILSESNGNMQQLKITQSVTARTETVESYLRDIGPLQMISPEEETELALRIQEGDEDAKRRLVEANLRFVVSCAKVYQNQGLDLGDLINEGNIGLIKAAERFDPTRGFRFISYAVWWIRQQIMQAISEQGRTIRLPQNQVGNVGRINREKARFLQENGREPSDLEIAERLGIDAVKAGDAVAASARALSLDTPMGEDGDGTLLDILPDGSAARTDESLGREDLRTDLKDVLSVLTPRERDIVSLAYGIGCSEMTLEEIGMKYSLTRERVRQVKERAVRKLSRPAVRARLAQYL